MKKANSILIIILLSVIVSCKNGQSGYDNEQYGVAKVLEVQGCEYVVWNVSNAGGIVHKQNCKFCAYKK